MHERTQRAIARLLFVLFCALPTSLTTALIIVRWTPWYHSRCLAEIEQQVGSELGVLVELENFVRMSPTQLELLGVRLLEPETGQVIGSTRTITFVRLNDRTAIHLGQPVINSAQMRMLWRTLHEHVLCRPDRNKIELRMRASDLTIQSRSGAMTFQDVDFLMKPAADSIQVFIAGTRADVYDTTPIQLNIRRDRAGTSPTTVWELQSGSTPLPCSAIADFAPHIDLGRLGSEALFSGKIRWQISEGQWLLNLQGSRFTQVDLSRLFETLPHRLTGTADIVFDRGFIDPGRRIDVHGAIIAREGYVGDSLFRSANAYLRMGVAVDAVQQVAQPFDRLALRFNINGAQMQLTGICASERGFESLPARVVVCADGRPLAWTTDELLPSTELARAIAPVHSVQVPLAQQTASIISLLLPPSRQLPSNNTSVAPRITRSQTWSGTPPITQPAPGQQVPIEPAAAPANIPVSMNP